MDTLLFLVKIALLMRYYNAVNVFSSTSSLHRLMLKDGVSVKDKKPLNIEIGANIKHEREKAGYTQDVLSEKVGIGVKSLSAIERGTIGISLTTLRKICQVLSIPSDFLLFGDTPKRDVQDIAQCLERLSDKEYEIASDVLRKLLEAFSLR